MRPTHFVVLAALTFIPARVLAAGDEPATPAPAQRSASPDFLFQPPKGAFSIRWSWNVLRADSDWFGFVQDQLTLDHNDFIASGVAGDVTVGVTPRLSVVIGADYTRRTNGSEYRDFTDTNGQSIVQTTQLHEASFTGGVRYDITRSGRPISTLAWVPMRFVPYAGGGAGVMYYDLQQWGDFVDFADLSVFGDQFPSSGWAPTVYANGGTDILIGKRFYLTFDARYQWASADLDKQTWTGFEPINLGGVRLSTGIKISY